MGADPACSDKEALRSLTREIQFRRFLDDAVSACSWPGVASEVLNYTLDLLEMEVGALCRLRSDGDGFQVEAVRGLPERVALSLADQASEVSHNDSDLETIEQELQISGSRLRSSAALLFGGYEDIEALIVASPRKLPWEPRTQRLLHVAASCLRNTLGLARMRASFHIRKDRDALLRLLHRAVRRGLDRQALARLVVRQITWRCQASRAFAALVDYEQATIIEQTAGPGAQDWLHFRARYPLASYKILFSRLENIRSVVSTPEAPLTGLESLHRALRLGALVLASAPMTDGSRLVLGLSFPPEISTLSESHQMLLQMIVDELALAMTARSESSLKSARTPQGARKSKERSLADGEGERHDEPLREGGTACRFGRQPYQGVLSLDSGQHQAHQHDLAPRALDGEDKKPPLQGR